MIQITAEAVTFASGLIGSAVWGVPVLRKLTKRVEPFLAKEAPVIAHEANAALSFVAHLAETPWFAGVAAKGKVEAHHVIGQLEKSELARVSAQAVGAFTKSLGVVVFGLSATQKIDLSEYIRSQLHNVGVKVSDQQIVASVREAQSALERIEQAVIPSVQAHDAVVKAWAEPVPVVASAAVQASEHSATAPLQEEAKTPA